MLLFVAYAVAFLVVAGGLLIFVNWTREKHPKWRNVLAFVLAAAAGFCGGFALYLYGFSFAISGEFRNFVIPICIWTFIAFTLHMLAYTASSSTRVLALPYLLNGLLLLMTTLTRGISILSVLPIFVLALLMYVGKQREKDESLLVRRDNLLRVSSERQTTERPRILLSISQATGGLAAVLCELLQSWGYSPTAVSGIEQVKRQLRNISYDLLILDLCDLDFDLPSADLFRLHPLILFLCCNEDMHTPRIPPGCLAVVTKPVDVSDLFQKLRELLREEKSLTGTANSV